jgi:hypothetical protein
MKKKIIVFNIMLMSMFALFGQTRKERPNIINYFASNNQIIGTPMVDQDNEFRFYPDLSFQDAITGIEVYYFVLNDVYKHHLTKREDGRYWSCIIRDFSLGEAIQRVEVIVDCKVDDLNKTLSHYGLKSISIKDFNPYLLLRRGEDRTLYNIALYENLKLEGQEENEKLSSKLEELNLSIVNLDTKTEQVSTKLKDIISGQESLAKTYNKLGKDYSSFQANLQRIETKYRAIKELPSEELDKLKVMADTTQKKYEKFTAEIHNNPISVFAEHVTTVNRELKTDFNIFKTTLDTSVVREIGLKYKAIQEKIKSLTLADIPTNYEREREAIRQIGAGAENRLYSAYVENRAASILDMRYKKSDNSIIQFNYRNDKQSLQYLQAGDPQEKLGIFRARLVPFPFYSQSNIGTVTADDNFKWQRGKVIYEIGINFGYAIVKGDHFIPKFFDINRLGLGIGISADTFSDKPTFLSVSLTYDMNTYTSLSFGANLMEKSGFYLGVGINARAFKDLVKNSGALFK